jgi:hypothetical protein
MITEVSWAIIGKREILITWEVGARGWSLPGGIANPCESSQAALLRGLNERFVDLRVNGSPVVWQRFEPSTGNPKRITIFLVETGEVVIPNPKKVADSRWIYPITAKQHKLPDEAVEALHQLQELRRHHPPKILE